LVSHRCVSQMPVWQDSRSSKIRPTDRSSFTRSRTLALGLIAACRATESGRWWFSARGHEPPVACVMKVRSRAVVCTNEKPGAWPGSASGVADYCLRRREAARPARPRPRRARVPGSGTEPKRMSSIATISP